MARAYMDAPIDQTITPEMQQAIEPILVDLIEKYGLTDFITTKVGMGYFIGE